MIPPRFAHHTLSSNELDNLLRNTYECDMSKVETADEGNSGRGLKLNVDVKEEKVKRCKYSDLAMKRKTGMTLFINRATPK